MSIWAQMNCIPRAGLEMWNHHEAGVSTNGHMADYSGNARHLTVGSNQPVITPDVINDEPAWYWDGTKSGLQNGTTINAKHIFLLAGHELAAFTQQRGLLTGVTSGDALLSEASGTKFVNSSPTLYRRNGVTFAAANMQAPMVSVGILEAVFSAGISPNGTVLGEHGSVGGRRWKGWATDLIVYSRVLSEIEVYHIYRYYAWRYWLWQISGGLNVWPFLANKSRGYEQDREYYLSEPYSGETTALLRGEPKESFLLSFTNRTQAEFLAARQFHRTHYPNTKFVYRDHRFRPYRETVVKFTSQLREQGSDVSMRFNYSFEISEA